MVIRTVGLIGAGTMGNGIAQACAVAGLRAVMVDINDAAVQKGLATVAGSLERLVKKDKLSAADRDAAMARIHGATSYDDLKAAQIVVEAATENHELKLKILKQVLVPMINEAFFVLAEYGDSKYRPCPLLRELVAAGRLGRKAGRGVYAY